MIDKVKLEVEEVDLFRHLNNPKNTGKWKFNGDNETSELEKHYCKSGDLFIQIFTPKNNLHATGSLPTILNGNNLVDLSVNELLQTFQILQNTFMIDPNKAIIRNLEFGLNIEVPEKAANFINRFLLYETKAFSRPRSENARNKFYGSECDLSQFRIKIYDKGAQMMIDKNLIRFEIKVNRMQFFKQRKVNIKYLSDLSLEANLNDLGRVLIEIYDKIFKVHEISFERLKPKYHEFMKLGRYAEYWERLHNENKQKCYRSRNRFAKLQAENITVNLHKETKERIEEKWKCLKNESSPLSQRIKLTDEVLPLLAV